MTFLNFWGLDRAYLEQLCSKNQIPKYNAALMMDWVYKKKVFDFELMSNISKLFRSQLKETCDFELPEVVKTQVSSDATRKLLLRLEDSSLIETVLINERSRNTICLSTQLGCKYSCKFCVSGRDGFVRNLKTHEIIGQYIRVSQNIDPANITNVVFMGIGEPLDNLDNVLKAINILKDPKGIALGKRKISISTCGLANKIDQLAANKTSVNLCVSLHSADDSKRTSLMPVNKKYPLRELIQSLKRFSKTDKAPIIFEYLLISGFNTSKEDADKLVNFVRGVPYKINLIAYNESGLEDLHSPSSKEIENFTNILKKRKVFYTLRKPKGQDIDAACGQLKAGHL